MFAAETAYLFRHALLRDAAYDLQPPEERARLHALAHDTIELVFNGRETELDALAAELALHAGVAASRDHGYRPRERDWLLRAARHATLGWRGADAAALYLRAAEHAEADAAQRCAAFCGAGKALIDIGKLQPALAALERGLGCAPGETARLSALRPLSYAYRNVGRNEDALSAAREIERIGRSSTDPMERALMLDAIATALMGLERNAEALPVAEQAVEFAAHANSPRLLGGMRANLGVLLGRMGSRVEGIATLRHALQDMQATDDRRAIAAARRNLADQMRANGELEGAMPECEAALREMHALGDARGEGMAALTLGGIHRDSGRPEEALALLKRAAELLDGSGDLRAAGVCHVNSANALLDLSRFADCEAAIRRALDCGARSDSPRVTAMATAAMAGLREDQGRLLEAADWFGRAFEAYTRLGDHRQAAWQVAEQAIALRRASDAGAEARWAEALGQLNASAPADVSFYAAKWLAAST